MKHAEQRVISLAAMSGRLEGSADALANVLQNWGDIGMAGVLIRNAEKNLRIAAAEVREIYRREAVAKELQDE